MATTIMSTSTSSNFWGPVHRLAMGAGAAILAIGFSAAAQTPSQPPASPPTSSASANMSVAPGSAPAERLDPIQARKAAEAAGLKDAPTVPNPVRCPQVAAPRGEVRRLSAQDKLAPLVLDPDVLLREDFSLAEVVGFFGRPVLCDQPTPRYLNLYLLPQQPNVRQVSLGTEEGKLISILVTYDKPVVVDTVRLASKYGPVKHGMGPRDALRAGTDQFTVHNPAFTGMLSFEYSDSRDPQTGRRIHQMGLSRIYTKQTP